jgi:hypothetical protein
MSRLWSDRRLAYAIVIGACALPRAVLLLHERSALVANFEKSQLLAQLYLRTGTFGYVPGHPSAYTQPLYGFFLVAVFWLAGFHWWTVGTAQLLVAVATSICVFEIGRRFLSARVGLLAAVIATLQPYLVWHDLHGNREILDQLLGAAMFWLALLAGSRYASRWSAAGLGLVSGLAILSNARLVLLPLALAAFVLWRGAGWLAAAAVPVLALVALAPWVVRNKVELGCFAITTDARSLWKANNPNTYRTLAAGLWLDQVPDVPERPPGRSPGRLPAFWVTPQEAGAYYSEHGVAIAVPECAQTARYEHLVFQFWEHHPGAKLRLAAQATKMLWDPRVGVEEGTGVDRLRRWVEPLYTVPLFALALAGLFLVPLAFRVLALIFVGYETAAAWVFAGTTRYRVPWDFVLALLAATTLDRLLRALERRRRRPAGAVA